MIQLTRTQKWYLGLALLVLLLVLASRSTSERFATSSSTAQAPSPLVYDEFASVKSYAEAEYAPSERVGGLALADTAVSQGQEDSREERVIKQAELDMLVDSVKETHVSLQEIAKTHGGFVRDASIYERGDKTLYGQTVLRVEVGKFEAALDTIRSLALNVERERLTGTDVTEQFSDLAAQLRNARAEEQAYLALLSRAGSVTELLEVQRELSQVRGRIEMFEGRLKYLADQTDLATITVSLSEKPSLIAPTGDFRFVDTIKDALQTLVVAFQEIVRGAVWIVILGIGIALPIGLIAWGLYRLYKRRMRT